jgi:cell division septum initiation protein DivIVA
VEQKKVINQKIIQLQKENNALRKANEELKKELVEKQKYILQVERAVTGLRTSIDNLVKQQGKYNTEKAYEQLVAMYKSQMEE